MGVISEQMWLTEPLWVTSDGLCNIQLCVGNGIQMSEANSCTCDLNHFTEITSQNHITFCFLRVICSIRYPCYLLQLQPSWTLLSLPCFFFPQRFYLFFFRERRRKRWWETCVRETSISCLSHTPNWGPGPQPRRVPWLGIEPATFQLPGWHPVHWATPARVERDP